MTRLYLIRHAEAEGNLYRRVHGWYNSRITPVGRLQIKRLEERISQRVHAGERIDALYASDLSRTMETAGAVSRAAGVPIRPCPGLREIQSGEWEDLPWGYCSRNHPDLLRDYTAYPDWRVPGGESAEELCIRLSGTLFDILAENEGNSVCLVSHSVAIRALLCAIYDLTAADLNAVPMVSNASVSAFDYDGSVFTPVYVNDASHTADIVQLKARLPEGVEAQSTQLWYRPAALPLDMPLIVQFWKSSWLAVHGDLYEFDADAVISEASRMLRANPGSVCFGMLDDREIGILIMDSADLTEDDCGHISLFAVAQEYRGCHFAVQLLGQAVSFYRGLGRKYLKLRVSPVNAKAISFYEKNDFIHCGYSTGPNRNLLLMKKAI